MNGWIIVANRKRAVAAIANGLPVVAADAHIHQPDSTAGRHLKIINLCNTYRYQTEGYGAAALADGAPPRRRRAGRGRGARGRSGTG